MKYEDAVAYWQLSSMYCLLFEVMANAQNLYYILQTQTQSLTCAKASNLTMSVTRNFSGSLFLFLSVSFHILFWKLHKVIMTKRTLLIFSW